MKTAAVKRAFESRITRSDSVPFSFFRYSTRDSIFVVLAVIQAAVLLSHPTIPVIAIGLCWNSNTIAHNFIHSPFFKSREFNRAFMLYQTLLLGIPQTLWRDRHMAHHANRPWKLKLDRPLGIEIIGLLILWTGLVIVAPKFCLTHYFPGLGLGLILCYLQGYYEHASGVTSNYSFIYNLLFFNDGYHTEHHFRPQKHWSELPTIRLPSTHESRWPPVFRFLDAVNLDNLEKLAIRSHTAQRVLLFVHRKAFKKLLPNTDHIREALIVGGGIFPRSAIILRELIPYAQITIIEEKASHIKQAQKFLGPEVSFVNEPYSPPGNRKADLVIIPLAYRGDRPDVLSKLSGVTILMHDWIWRRTDKSAVISLLLLKRLNRFDL